MRDRIRRCKDKVNIRLWKTWDSKGHWYCISIEKDNEILEEFYYSKERRDNVKGLKEFKSKIGRLQRKYPNSTFTDETKGYWHKVQSYYQQETMIENMIRAKVKPVHLQYDYRQEI